MRTALALFALGLGCSSSDPPAAGGDAGGEVRVEPPCHPELKDGDPCTGTYVASCTCGPGPIGAPEVLLICCYLGHIMRWSGCADPGGPPSCGEPPDTGVDAPTSARSAADFSSFTWNWSGLGLGGSFTLDKACHLESQGKLSYSTTVKTGSGTVPAAECDAFKSFVVSDAIIAAYDLHGGDAGTCTGATDDYVGSTISLAGGDSRTISFANGSGCGTIEPFVTLISKMATLSSAYATSPLDAGAD